MKPMIPIYAAVGIVALGGVSLMFLGGNGEPDHEDIQMGFTEEERPTETYEGTAQEMRRLIADFQATQQGFEKLQEGYEDTIRDIEQKNRKFEAQLKTEKRARQSAIERYDREQDKEMKKAINSALRVLAENQANSKHETGQLQDRIKQLQAEIEELQNRPLPEPVVVQETVTLDSEKATDQSENQAETSYSVKSQSSNSQDVSENQDWNQVLQPQSTLPEIVVPEMIELKPIGGKVEVKKDRKRQRSTSRRVNYRSESRTPSRQRKPAKKASQTIPIFTVNSGAIMKARLMNAAIGMVAFGGQVNAFTTHAVIKNSKKNPAASGFYLAPEVGEMRIMGPAVGMIAVGCSLVSITKAVFIFQDGTIHEVEASAGKPFGFLDDRYGRGCLFGEKIHNIDNYAANEAFYATLDGSIRSLQKILTQDQYSKVVADGAADGANTWAKTSSDLHKDTKFAGIYVAANQPVNFVTNQMIKIDYSPDMRKLAHDATIRGFTHRLHPD